MYSSTCAEAEEENACVHLQEVNLIIIEQMTLYGANFWVVADIVTTGIPSLENALIP